MPESVKIYLTSYDSMYITNTCSMVSNQLMGGLMTMVATPLYLKIRDEADISIICEPEYLPINGNASAIDPETDKAIEDFIASEIESGNEWAWCMVSVLVEWNGLSTSEVLGGCSYRSEQDFKESGYYGDMLHEAIKDLCSQASKIASAITA